MSKLLRETLLDNNKNKINTEELQSETGFFETFVPKNDQYFDFRNVNIKLRSSAAYKYKCLNKVHEEPKYKGKIIFPIIETILIDKGQINQWLFTDERAGYVMKKNSKKLVKDYVLRYFVGIAIQKIAESSKTIDKKIDRIMEDIRRFLILSDQNYNAKKEFIGEFDYLEDFHELYFIYLKFSGNVDKMVNVFDLFNLFGDANKINDLLLIQNFLNINIMKSVYCQFKRKDLLGAKKFCLYTKFQNSEGDFLEEGSDVLNCNSAAAPGNHPQRSQNFSNSGNFHNTNINNNNNNNVNTITSTNNNNNNYNNNLNYSSNNNTNINGQNSLNLNGSGSNLISFNNNNNNNTNNINNNNNNNNQINNTASHKNTNSKSNNTLGNTFAKKQMHHKKKEIEKDDDEEEETKKQIDVKELTPLNNHNLAEFMASICEPFIELLEKSKGIFIYETILMFHKDFEGKLLFRFCDNIQCKSRLTPEELKEDQRRKETMKKIFVETVPEEIQKNVRKYEKVTKNAKCTGEFCDYNIPKFFKNMNKFNKEDLAEFKNIDSKFIERKKNHDLNFILPYFIIKKAYDNENLVNIVLKAYSIFPKKFDRDGALLQLQKAKQLEEEMKEEENKKEAERLKMEEKIKRMGKAATHCEEVKNFLMNQNKRKSTATPDLLKSAVNNAATAEGVNPIRGASGNFYTFIKI